MDYWIGGDIRINIDSTHVIKANYSTERDQGTQFEAYGLSTSNNYVTAAYLYDNEKDYDVFNFAVHYPVKNFKLGYDFQNDINKNKTTHSAYVSYSYKWAYTEITFFDKVNRLKIELNPEVKVDKSVFIGIKGTAYYITEIWKRNLGLTLKIKI